MFSTRYSPDLYEAHNHERRADGWAISVGLGAEWEEREDPSVVLDLEIGLDGSGRHFCGRAAKRLSDGRLAIFEVIVAGLTTRFLAVLGDMYAASNYFGPADVGLAVTGLRGGISFKLSEQIGIGIRPTPFDKDRYRRTERFSAATHMNDPRGAARRLVLPLTQAITRESYDPFSGSTI